MKRIALAAATVAAVTALALTGCSSSGRGGDATESAGASAGFAADSLIGIALPDKTSENWVLAGGLFDDGLKAAGFKADVQYAPASNTVAEQQNQISAMITNGAKVIVIGAKDGKQLGTQLQQAADAGVTVIAYDRLIENTPNVNYYVAFDNFKVGELQGQALLTALGSKATKSSKVVMINGDDNDPNAAQFKKGAHSVLDGKVNIAYEQSGLWKDTVAAQKMSAAITQLGAKNIAGVYSANDGMAGGIATTLKGAGISGIPLTGQDAELAAIQRIVAGTQSATVYKAFKPEAEAAATLAVDLLQGKSISSLATSTQTSGSGDKVPSQLLIPVSVTKANIKDTVVKDGLYTVAQICTAQYASACKAAGLQ